MTMLKRKLKAVLVKAGIISSPHKNNIAENTNMPMHEGLKRFSNRNLEINTIVDVGAAQGTWSLNAKNFFPDANYLLFEPLVEREGELDLLCKKNKKFQFIPKAAGNTNSTIHFKISKDLDGSGIANGDEINEELREIEIVRLDEEVKKHQLKGPYLIKLDTHGFEVPIIEGCENIINEVNLFIIECYGFHLTKDSLLFAEMCDLMFTKGFRLFDVVDIMRRPKDEAFWQCDAFFIPKNHLIFEDNNYR